MVIRQFIQSFLPFHAVESSSAYARNRAGKFFPCPPRGPCATLVAYLYCTGLRIKETPKSKLRGLFAKLPDIHDTHVISFSSLIQTILSVRELHPISRLYPGAGNRIHRNGSRTVTAGRELHPAPKNFSHISVFYTRKPALSRSLSDFIGRLLVNATGKTNVSFGAACFSFVAIISYNTKE